MAYKDQVLGVLQNEHSRILAEVNKQRGLIESLEAQYRKLNEQFNEKKVFGMTVLEAQSYEGYFRRLEKQMKIEYQKLTELEKKAEIKREEVVEAKKETSSIEKLKEKKLEQYQKDIQKSEELFIDEFVNLRRLAN